MADNGVKWESWITATCVVVRYQRQGWHENCISLAEQCNWGLSHIRPTPTCTGIIPDPDECKSGHIIIATPINPGDC